MVRATCLTPTRPQQSRVSVRPSNPAAPHGSRPQPPAPPRAPAFPLPSAPALPLPLLQLLPPTAPPPHVCVLPQSLLLLLPRRPPLPPLPPRPLLALTWANTRPMRWKLRSPSCGSVTNLGGHIQTVIVLCSKLLRHVARREAVCIASKALRGPRHAAPSQTWGHMWVAGAE